MRGHNDVSTNKKERGEERYRLIRPSSALAARFYRRSTEIFLGTNGDDDGGILTFNVSINRRAINRGRARGAVSLIKLHSPLMVYK